MNILMQISEGDGQEKKNKHTIISEGDEQEKKKHTIAMKKFEDFRMVNGESITEMETQFMKLLSKVANLGKGLSQKEINLKILRGFLNSWVMKVMTMRDHRDLKAIHTSQIFSDFRAYEFEREPRCEDNESKSVALVIVQQPSTYSRSNSNSSDFLTDEQFAMFVRKFKRFMRKNNIQGTPSTTSSSTRRHFERSSTSKSKNSEGL